MINITEIYADKIIDPIDPMRIELDKDAIFELAESIKQEGLIQPITVRLFSVDGADYNEWRREHPGLILENSFVKYEVVAGHRRFRACAIAGVIKIPCIIKELNDDQMIEIRAHENLFRQDLDPVEEAIAIGKLVGEDDSKIPNIAKRMSKSVAWVEERLDILTYPDYFLSAIRSKKISLGVVKHLARIQDDIYRKMFFDQAVSTGMAVWQAEYYYRQWEAGIFKEGAEIMPPDIEIDKPQSIKVRVHCERCGQIAESPNFKNVFIHIECPADEAPPSS